MLYLDNPFVKYMILDKNNDNCSLLDLLVLSYLYEIRFVWKNEFLFFNSLFEYLSLNEDDDINDLSKIDLVVVDLYFKRNPTLKDINFVTKEINQKLANAFTLMYFFSGEARKHVYNHQIAAQKFKLDSSLIDNTSKEEIRICKTYDIDGILGGVRPENIGRSISCRFQLNLDCKNNYSQTLLLTKKYFFLHNNTLIDLSICDAKFIGKFPLKIGELNIFLVNPKKFKDLRIRNHKLFDSIKKIKNYDTEVSHSKELFLLFKQIDIDYYSYKATDIISVENINLFFTLLNLGINSCNNCFYFAKCTREKS